jgi:hypothetical protein
MSKTWEVEIRVNGETILTLGSSHLSGIENIDDYANDVRNCAQHLLSFIGEPGGVAQCAPAAPLTVINAASPDIIGVLKSVHSALDSALGDTDISHIENDDELREEHPVQWAAEWLAHSIELLEGGSALTSTDGGCDGS